MRHAVILAAAMLTAPAFAEPPVAKVAGHAIVHPGEGVAVRVPRAATYVGSDRFTLYGVADCEIHVFVEADARHRLRRLYWIQFESYLPSLPDKSYDYAKGNTGMMIGGIKTWVRAGPISTTGPTREGSDREHVAAMRLGDQMEFAERVEEMIVAGFAARGDEIAHRPGIDDLAIQRIVSECRGSGRPALCGVAGRRDRRARRALDAIAILRGRNDRSGSGFPHDALHCIAKAPHPHDLPHIDAAALARAASMCRSRCLLHHRRERVALARVGPCCQVPRRDFAIYGYIFRLLFRGFAPIMAIDS